MQHLFITHPDVVSSRWQQAFPQAQIVDYNAKLPAQLSSSILWIVLSDDFVLEKLSSWIALGARVVILTQTENPQQAKQVLELGASGYLHYLAAVPVLEQVNQVVQVGGLWLGADLMRQLVSATANILRPTITSPKLDSLTLREKSVAEAVAAGKTNKEVARELDITERTVKAHLGSVFDKLKVRDRLQLVLVMSGK